MNRSVIVREGWVFVVVCVAFIVLAMVLPPLFRIELWPILTTMPFAPLVIPFYVLVRWIFCRRRYH